MVDLFNISTPVAVSLIWTMMFHPQLGVLNYLLSLVGLPPSQWVFSPGTVIPSLILVEIWLWTPFCMIIVLGGLASLPTEPYEAALIDGASQWQMFWKITYPLVLPFLVVALAGAAMGAKATLDDTARHIDYLQQQVAAHPRPADAGRAVTSMGRKAQGPAR